MRIQKLQKMLLELNIEALLIEDPIDIFYLTECHVTSGSIIVTPDDSCFCVDGRYIESCKRQCPFKTVLTGEKGVVEVIEDLFSYVKEVGVCSDRITLERFEKLKDKVPKKKWISCKNLVAELRVVKDEKELNVLREAAELGSKGYDHVLSILKEGITEIEVAKQLEIFWLQQGADALGFDPIIAFNASTSMPHYHPQKIALKKGDPVLIDIGVKWKGYHSDMTRVISFGSEMSEKMKEIYAIVLEAQTRALAKCRAGTKIGDVDRAARDFIEEKGFKEHFQHGLGHGVGLEIHEAPTLKSAAPFGNKVLKEGMVVTIEPGVYLSGVGGVRIEDTVIVTKDGCEDITKRSKEIKKV